MQILKFLSNAEINKVSVHVAYCKTLLAKLYMIRNLYNEDYFLASNKKAKDSLVNTYLREAKKIYKDFQNEYGIMRIKILESLYHIVFLSNKDEQESEIKKMADILKDYQEYQREINIVDFLQKKLVKNENLRVFVLAILRAYPIIMQ